MARRKQKQLLSEGEMRRFMKLAKISPINEMEHPGMRDDDAEKEDEPGMRDYMQEQEEEEMEVSADEMEMGAPDAEAPEMDMDMEPEMDMDMEPEMAMDMPAAGGTVDIEDFMNALERALEDVTGEEVSTEMDLDDEGAPLEGGDELDMEMPPEPAMDMDMDDEEEMDMDKLAESIARRVRRKMALKENKKRSRTSKDRIVENTYRRVMKRINSLDESQKSLDKRADELTEKIFRRLIKESR